MVLDSMDPGKKKLFAAVAVIILILVAVGVAYRPGGPMNPGKMQPVRYSIPPPNYAVTTGPRDNNEPTIAISTTDPKTMVAGSNDYNTPNSDAWCGFYTTHDGGKNWTESFIPGYPSGPQSALTGFGGAGDPVCVAAPDGSFYFAGIAFKRARMQQNPIGFGWHLGLDNCVFVARSTDNGDSFSQVVIVWAAFESLVRFDDKEWVAVDPNNANNVYLAWVIFTGMLTARLMLSRSTDGGQSWSRPIAISETTSGELNLQGTAIVVDKKSVVHVTWIDYGNNNIRYAFSTNQGQSFSTPVNVAPITPIPTPLPHGNYRTPDMTALAVDTGGGSSDGALYVTWADYGSGDADVLLSYSHDNGKSWEGPVRVNNDTDGNGADQFFPAVAVSAEGWVHVGFYDRRSDPNDTLLEYWWAMSFDGGTNFSINIPMSNASFNGDYSRTGTNDFIGDYTGIVANNQTVAAVWCDMREGTESAGQSQIYCAAVPYKELLKDHKWPLTIPWPADNSTKK
jgi:hypothetical protein